MKQKQYVKLFEAFQNENENNDGYTMYTGITLDAWENIWKDKNIDDRETNVTKNIYDAFEYSYNWDTGEYEDVVVQIENIPLEAFIYARDDDFEDDEDVIYLGDYSDEEKIRLIKNAYDMFLINLNNYKEDIKVSLIKRNDL